MDASRTLQRVKTMERENAIIIDGVKHTLVREDCYDVCNKCSLSKPCAHGVCTYCREVFGNPYDAYFKILNQEQNGSND